jgi:hypothetical protein
MLKDHFVLIEGYEDMEISLCIFVISNNDRHNSRNIREFWNCVYFSTLIKGEI